MEKMIPEVVFMSVRVSNWIDKPVYACRRVDGAWQVRLNQCWPPRWQLLSDILKGRDNVYV